MALLTQSEAVAFNGFLSSVDFSDVLEWSTVAGLADGSIPIPPPPEKGKEAILAKAAKDLMSLEPTVQHESSSSLKSSFDTAPAANANWPNFPGDSSGRPRNHTYTYGFGAPSRNSHKPHIPSLNPPGGPSQAIPENLFNFQRSPSRTSSASPFRFSSSSTPTNIDPSLAATSGRPAQCAAPSTTSALNNRRPSSSKRGLPHDSESWPDGPRSLATSKRRRPSVATTTTPAAPTAGDKQPASTRARATRASSTSSSASPSVVVKTDAETPSVGSGPSSKPALLSPSQKRANHIQSEQKRRANIRRGYEALCDAVPALREAIKLEEEAVRAAEEDAQGRAKRKRKGKGAAAADDAVEKVSAGDGRAGPKSENVVLQKTIDHLHTLLAEQASLKARLERARSALAPGHPALTTAPNHLDEKGVPLWEREWTGGTGWKDNEDEGDEE